VAVNALKWKRLTAIRNYLGSTVLSKVESVDEGVDRIAAIAMAKHPSWRVQCLLHFSYNFLEGQVLCSEAIFGNPITVGLNRITKVVP
jgi:hypothetical protein